MSSPTFSCRRWSTVFPFLTLFFLVITPQPLHAAWFDSTWKYRVPVNIPAGTAINSTIKVDVDFAALLTSLGAAGTFDINSPRIVRPNDSLSTNQQYTDRIYGGVTDAANNSRGEIRFILEDAGPATYFLYFDVTASGVKAVNPQTPINGNFEFGTAGGTSPQIPPGWLNATRTANTMDSQIRPAETVLVVDNTTATTNGNPNTGLASYLQGFRSSTDIGGDTVLTKTITIPASNPGLFRLSIRPEGWDSGQDGNTTNYDFLQVRLLNGTTVVLDIVGPSLNNYTTCPFSPNYRIGAISTTQPGYGQYNYWDNGTISNHILGMSGTYNRGQEPWINCSANLAVASVTGQTLTLEIRSNHVNQFRSWFLIDDVEWSVITATLGSPNTYNGSIPANFNCVEVGGNALTGHLYTKLAGTPFAFDVVALKSDGSVETSYAANSSKNVTVELVNGAGSTACSSRTALSPTVSQTLTFAPTNLGRKAITALTLNNAYPNLRCRVTDANQSPSIIGCSTDNFSIRPTGFTLSSSNASADGTGASTSSTPIIKAGANFALSAAALTASSGAAVGYNLAPQLDTSKLAAHSGALQTGALMGSFSAAAPATGIATGSAFTYSEVGYFRFTANGIYDVSFTSVDSIVNDCTNDFSNNLVSGLYGCYFGNITATNYFGRFIPDHFAITPGSALPSCNSTFTYFGEDGFSTLFTLLAQNASNITTQNYHGGFARLGLTVWSGFNFSAASLPSGSILSASATAPVGSWNQGVADVVANHQVSRPTALTGETSVAVNAAPIDLDGVTMTAAAIAPGTPLRYGRIALQNAFGSELLDLPMSMTAEYWDSNVWKKNTDDQCTTGITLTKSLVTGPITTLCAWDTGTPGNSGLGCSTAGIAANIYSEPPPASAGGNFNLNFQAPGAGNTGAFDIGVVATTLDYLKFNWKGTGNEFPSARATFGIYKSNESQIFIREVY
ncbi:hypothetical protein MCAMS1_01833 [biofilm metagenome]